MKVYFRVILLLSLFVLSFLGIKGTITDNSQFSSKSLPNRQCYELSGCTKLKDCTNSCGKLGSNPFHYYTDCAAIKITDQGSSQDSYINQRRLRKGIDLSVFFRNVMQQLSFRDDLLIQDKSRTFCSFVNHRVLPSCQYYIFTLRRIII